MEQDKRDAQIVRHRSARKELLYWLTIVLDLDAMLRQKCQELAYIERTDDPLLHFAIPGTSIKGNNPFEGIDHELPVPIGRFQIHRAIRAIGQTDTHRHLPLKVRGGRRWPGRCRCLPLDVPPGLHTRLWGFW